MSAWCSKWMWYNYILNRYIYIYIFVSWEAILWKAPTGQYYVKNPNDAIPREISRNFLGNIHISLEIARYPLEIGLRLACSLAIQLTTLHAASHSRYHVHQETSEGPEDRRLKRSSFIDAAFSRHKASLCAVILSSCRLSHGKPVS